MATTERQPLDLGKIPSVDFGDLDLHSTTRDLATSPATASALHDQEPSQDGPKLLIPLEKYHNGFPDVPAADPTKSLIRNEEGFPFETATASPNGVSHASPPKVVQFSPLPSSPDHFTNGHAHHSSAESTPSRPLGYTRQTSSFMNRFRNIRNPMPPDHARNRGVLRNSMGSEDGMDPGVLQTPREGRSSTHIDGAHAENEEIDADAEDSGEETTRAGTVQASKRRRMPWLSRDGLQTTSQRHITSDSSTSTTPQDGHERVHHIPARSSTMEQIPENNRLGMSEDEGRDRMTGRHAWKRRPSSWRNAGRTPTRSSSQQRMENVSESPRPGNFRRITGIGRTDGAPSPWRARSELGAAKWKQLKAGLRLLGKQRKEENKIDQAKSAELMAELLAGSPAAIILASRFQRDEKQKRNVPVLLEQIKTRVVDSYRREDSEGDRHVVFRVELEYGSGLMRMKWVIQRSLRDFANLHLKYKLLARKVTQPARRSSEAGRAKFPEFPRSAFPYLRGVRGLFDDEDDNEETTGEELSASEALQRKRARMPKMKLTRSGSSFAPGIFAPPRRPSSTAANSYHGVVDSSAQPGNDETARVQYADRQRKRLEIYLQELIHFLIFRAGANRLCRFLELSALGVRLAAEGGYHGKEGALVLQSGKGMDFRRSWKPNLIIQRHSPMWFLVRHSYIVCVDSPEEMNIYDVFLVDPGFEVQSPRKRVRDQTNAKDVAKTAGHTAAHPQKHVLRLQNSERKIKLLAKNERQLVQFEESIRFMASNTEWGRPHRFDSFAPIRKNVFAQWLVDGRDYMWNVSRAISMAQDVIYIHDWWLSPELYMRRPSAISHKWRLDRLLKRKAEEGVKIFVIMYRNINSAIPIDSEYTKFSLLDLHPNIFVQRSPNQVRQNIFFWAHHEKLCIVDHTIAFCGGVDLCFGRWDTPQHSVVDDKLTGFEPTDMPKDADHCQLWPGKDYSNPRVLDFFRLDDPYGEMYDRTTVPRMPWHDIGMQIVGQPARDLTRHFVQRWNYVLRQRKPTRPTPFLLPPPDFNPADLEALGLDGTCNVQMLRSACDWSIGTPGKVEHSIMTAYVKLIEKSEHFVYIENQFFITTSNMDGTKINNKIGDALVERIERAHRNGDDWLAIIVIPLVPGFPSTVDSQDGSSIRLIMQCQYRSICRGPTSIFERLRRAGIVPEEYIQFYSLRSWGKIGPTKAIVTEQLYIHAKIMVVDDRHAIIGSANINERSMLGSRDSEIAAIVWDNDMIESVMAGKPYQVGRFPHTLRMRLMREHLGVDVDEIMNEEREEAVWNEKAEDSNSSSPSDTESVSSTRRKLIESKYRTQDELIRRSQMVHNFNHDAIDLQQNNPHLRAGKKRTHDPRVTGSEQHRLDVEGFGTDGMARQADLLGLRGRDSVTLEGNREVLVNDVLNEGMGTLATPKESTRREVQTHEAEHGHAHGQHKSVDAARMPLPPPHPPRMNTQAMGLTQRSQLPALPVLDDTDIGGPPLSRTLSGGSRGDVGVGGGGVPAAAARVRQPLVGKDCMRDPLADSFFQDTWHAIAENNTLLFRQVFRCMPDNEVTTWREYEAFVAYSERFAHSMGMGKSNVRMQQEAKGKTGPPGHGVDVLPGALGAAKDKITPTHGSADNGVPGANSRLKQLFSRKGRIARQDEKESQRHEREAERVMAKDEKHRATDADAVAEAAARDGKDRTNIDYDNMPVSASVQEGVPRSRAATVDEEPSVAATAAAAHPQVDGHSSGGQGARRRRRGNTRAQGPLRATDPVLGKGEAEELMKLVQGHLVMFPYDWFVLLPHSRAEAHFSPLYQSTRSVCAGMCRACLLTRCVFAFCQAATRGARWQVAILGRPNGAARDLVSNLALLFFIAPLRSRFSVTNTRYHCSD